MSAASILDDPAKPTPSQVSALRWLAEHGGTGVFGRDGVLLAAGERAPVMRSTWNALTVLGCVERADKRLHLTHAGRLIGAKAKSGAAHASGECWGDE